METNRCNSCPFNQAANAFLDSADDTARLGVEGVGLDISTRIKSAGLQSVLVRARAATNICKGPEGDLELTGHQRCTNEVAISIGSIGMDRGF